MDAVAVMLTVMLTVTERTGHDRAGEPVRVGVPLFKGAAKTVEAMTLTDEEGTPIPCQFTPACLWLEDDSIKWVHLDFITSIKANEVRRLKLELDAGKNPAPADNLVLEEHEGRVTVSTGKLEVTVRGSKFNFFDSVRYDGKEIIPSQDEPGRRYWVAHEKGMLPMKTMYASSPDRVIQNVMTREVKEIVSVAIETGILWYPRVIMEEATKGPNYSYAIKVTINEFVPHFKAPPETFIYSRTLRAKNTGFINR